MVTKSTLNSFVVKLRTGKGWSQQQLADISGLGLRTIQRIEKGAHHHPESLQAIASAFDMNAEDFFKLNQPTLNSEDDRLHWITSGADLAQLLGGAIAHSFSHEELASSSEVEAIGLLLQECADYIDVFHDLPYTTRTETSARFSQHLDTLWKLDWLVFGKAQVMTMSPSPSPVRGKGIRLHLTRYDNPSVKLDPELRKFMKDFKASIAHLKKEATQQEEPPDPVH